MLSIALYKNDYRNSDNFVLTSDAMLCYTITLFLLPIFIYSFIVAKALSYLFRSNRKVLPYRLL